MLTILIGHRGVGKTSLLRRLKTYFPESLCFCLDEEVEKRFGPIIDIFREQGETAFRELEKRIFKELKELAASATVSFIATGAGYEGEIPPDCKVVWVQRTQDLSQFIFLDRPDLDPQSGTPFITPEAFQQRTERYRNLATAEYLMPEGEYSHHAEEETFFQNNFCYLGGCLTVLPHHARAPHFARWLLERCFWGIDLIELRDDLLTPEDMTAALKSIPLAKRLFSFRKQNSLQSSFGFAAQSATIDWPLEFGEPPAALQTRCVYSLHSELEEFEAALERLEKFEGPVKWSPLVDTITQLEKAHRWQCRNPQRSLLPRSANGKWAWYRLLQKNRQPLNFFREGKGLAADQPSLVQWAQHDTRHSHLAAVLGSPVAHSWTPSFHGNFFKDKKMAVVAVDITESELKNGGLEFLFELGFRAFAITSPLKPWAADLVGALAPLNTLAWNPILKIWEGTNTDKAGFLTLVQQAEILFTRGKNCVIWGGGGVIPTLKEVLPLAQLYSARTGRVRPENSAVESPSTVVWAGGETIQKITSCHPEWRPERVVDLSYRADSAGLAYAKAVGTRYFSGREMFFSQAEEQQKFWSRYEWK